MKSFIVLSQSLSFFRHWVGRSLQCLVNPISCLDELSRLIILISNDIHMLPLLKDDLLLIWIINLSFIRLTCGEINSIILKPVTDLTKMRCTFIALLRNRVVLRILLLVVLLDKFFILFFISFLVDDVIFKFIRVLVIFDRRALNMLFLRLV